MYVFSNGKKMDEYANELKDKFGYGDDLAFEITTMAESIIDYLGEEYTSIVLDAISQVKVVLVDGYRKTGVKETINDVLEREGNGGEWLER